MKDTELEADRYLLMVSILSDQNGRNFWGVSTVRVRFLWSRSIPRPLNLLKDKGYGFILILEKIGPQT